VCSGSVLWKCFLKSNRVRLLQLPWSCGCKVRRVKWIQF
jgi:hypothetical protein